MIPLWRRHLLSSILGLSLLLALAPAGLSDEHEHMEENRWDGFIPCAVGAPLPVTAQFFCGNLDPNDNRNHKDLGDPELLTLTGELEYDPFLPIGSDLSLQVRVEDSIHEFQGPSPIEFRLDAGSDFDILDHHQMIEFDVGAADGSVIYQQTFTLHYTEYYGAHAPSG